MNVCIFGISSDLGKSVAKKMYEKGYNICGTYFSNSNIISEFKNENIGIELYKCDIRNNDEVENTLEKVFAKYKKIDVLINMCAVSHHNLLIDETVLSINDQIDTNIKGNIYILKNGIKQMINQGSGNIINISSMVAEKGCPNESIYTLTKAAVNSITKSAGKEYGSSGLRINAIALGYFDTKMNNEYSKEDKKEILENIPLGKEGDIESIINTIEFIIKTDYLNAEIISLDGGWSK